MTTLNNDELREKIDIAWLWLTHNAHKESVRRSLDETMQLIATHDQQLLEAILDGKETYTVTEWGEPVDKDAVPVEHIKSVFEGRK